MDLRQRLNIVPTSVSKPSSKSSQAVSAAAIGNCIAVALFVFIPLRFASIEWSVNPQYSYGWGMPWLAAYLFWKRWADRPLPKPETFRGWLWGVILVIVAMFLPLRLMLEANPDWRLLLWFAALFSLSVCFLLLWSIGGKPWFRHFWIPMAFLLLAVPWPTRLEQELIQSFTQGISAATVEMLNWLGIPALLQGNLIHLGASVVGVNEACSGIRSFQTTLMIAVFFGEIYRLTPQKRLALIALGLAWTIFLNFLRTAFLTWLAAKKGADIQAAWHDNVGFFVLAVSIGGVLGMALLLARNSFSEKQSPPSSLRSPRFLPIRVSVIVISWFFLVEVANELWFSTREPSLDSQLTWAVSWPEAGEGFTEKELPEETQVLLRSDISQTGVWKRPDGSEWTMFFIKWHPGRMAAQLARGHTPDVCLPASGFKLVAQGETVVLSANNTQLPFATYVFDGNGVPWHVFFCLLEDRVAEQASLRNAREHYLSELEPTRRLRAVLEGKRHRGQQVFEIAMTGYSSLEEAQLALEQSLPQLVKVQAQ